MSEGRITIVDEKDNVIGAATRSTVRRQGLRHRIVRVFIINSMGQVLLQRRSLELDDSPGKWDQSVGGHVDEGEDYEQAAVREGLEELGVTLRELRNIGKLYVERPAQVGFIRRFQAVFTAQYVGSLNPSQTEVTEVRWLSRREIKNWCTQRPGDFTTNFIKAYSLLESTDTI
jgi:isopentenyl-diphosphate delta-isomerase type 1